MPRTGMSYDAKNEPLCETVTADGAYRYRYYEGDVVGIQKADPSATGGWKTEYVFRDNTCPCTGHQYRGDCKHKPICQALIRWWHDVGAGPAQEPTTEPTAPAGA